MERKTSLLTLLESEKCAIAAYNATLNDIIRCKDKILSDISMLSDSINNNDSIKAETICKYLTKNIQDLSILYKNLQNWEAEINNCKKSIKRHLE